MNVFISWSGQRSLAVAKVFEEMLPEFIQSLKPWISHGIDKGAAWVGELSKGLDNSAAGVVCLTNDNKVEPWILFECGALAKGFSDKSRICTFLIDLKPQDIGLPLSMFQATQHTEEEVWKLLSSLNACQKPDLQITEAKLKKTFDRVWPDFKKAIDQAIAKTPAKAARIEKKPEELIPEILTTVRNIERRIDDAASRPNISPMSPYSLNQPSASGTLIAGTIVPASSSSLIPGLIYSNSAPAIPGTIYSNSTGSLLGTGFSYTPGGYIVGGPPLNPDPPPEELGAPAAMKKPKPPPGQASAAAHPPKP